MMRDEKGNVIEPIPLESSIDELNIRYRIINALIADDIHTIGDLVNLSACSLRKLPDIGQRSITDLRMELKRRGRKLLDD